MGPPRLVKRFTKKATVVNHAVEPMSRLGRHVYFFFGASMRT
jgi:hypothetical protein